MMKTSTRLFLLLAGMSAWTDLHAQQTYEEMVRLTVNEQVTTVITASEPVLFVDISTDKVAGDQPMKDTIRLKPKEAGHADGEVLGIEMSEKQISGRTIALHIDYEDVLSADSFDAALLEEE